MGKMKQVYMEVWEEHGGVIPPGYTLQDYLAKEQIEHELSQRQEEETSDTSQETENKENSEPKSGEEESSQTQQS